MSIPAQKKLGSMSLDRNTHVSNSSEKLMMARARSSSVNKRRLAKLEELVGSLSRAYNETVGQALERHEYNFVLSDPRLPDHPIVYASEGFLRMSGYDRAEVLGRNCRFLQGPGTDRRTVFEIREAIREERPCQVHILNYTKQGQPFWNLFHMAPIYSRQDGNVIHYVGVQIPIAFDRASGVSSQTQEVVSGTVKELVETGNIRARRTIGGYLPQPVERSVNLRLRGGAAEAEEEDQKDEESDDEIYLVDNVLKEKAALAMRLVTCELTQSSRIKGDLAQSRPERVATGVVCSSLIISLSRIQQSFVLADPNLPDMPIVYASDVFCELTGYSREEVVGHNCRFMQGPETDPKDVQKIREAIEEEQACTVKILNYRKDKTPFYNYLHVAPVRSSGGKVAFYVGVQLDVTEVDTDMAQEIGMSAHAKQLGAVGVVRVAVRSLQGSGLRRTLKRATV
uniref:Putative LOV domain-containing protein n=1 Tax=Encalypta streptocarpa TaxID=81092 RepID=A0A126WZ25_9BRYO|nr:putative LOV domain-containing protein [Encalypta streptocarpa]